MSSWHFSSSPAQQPWCVTHHGVCWRQGRAGWGLLAPCSGPGWSSTQAHSARARSPGTYRSCQPPAAPRALPRALDLSAAMGQNYRGRNRLLTLHRDFAAKEVSRKIHSPRVTFLSWVTKTKLLNYTALSLSICNFSDYHLSKSLSPTGRACISQKYHGLLFLFSSQ